MQQLNSFEITEGDASCTASRCRWYEAACLGRSGVPFCCWDPTPAPAAPARSVWLSRLYSRARRRLGRRRGSHHSPSEAARGGRRPGVLRATRQPPTIMAALHIGLHSPPPRPPTASPRDSDAPPRPRIPAGGGSQHPEARATRVLEESRRRLPHCRLLAAPARLLRPRFASNGSGGAG